MKKCISTLLINFWKKYWYWIISLTIYLFLAVTAFQNKTELLNLLPIYKSFDFLETIFETVYILLLIGALVGLIWLLKLPLHFKRRRFQRVFQKNGLSNRSRELPVFISKKRDKRKKHGEILAFYNPSFAISDFEAKTPQLEAALNTKIYRIEFGKSTAQVLLYVISREYAKPTFISATNNIFGKEPIDMMINLLMVGATGTGKTYALKMILGKIIRFQPTAKIWILDFKHYDFRNFSGLPRHYGYTDCIQGLEDFYNVFKHQQNTGKAGVPQYIMIDEWGAFILSQDKKQADRLKNLLAELLMLGRSYNFRVVVGIQRAEANFFNSGARDQFRTILALGNLSKEQKQMLFSEYKEKMNENNGLGEGYLLIDGHDIEHVKIAPINDMGAIDESIREALSC